MSQEKVVAVYDPVKSGEYFKLKFSQAATLNDLSQEFFFFTHGLLFAVTKLADDPVFDFFSSLKSPCTPFKMEFDRAIFKGLNTKFSRKYNYTLFAAPRELMPGLEAHLSTVCVVDVEGNNYWHVAVQTVPIADPLALAKTAILPSPCPMVDITFLGIDSMLWTKGLEPSLNPPIELPRVVTIDPLPEVVTRGRMYLRQPDSFTRYANESFLSAEERQSRESSPGAS